MAKNIRMDSMTIEIIKELKEYTDDVKKSIRKIAKDVAQESADELHETSPKRTKRYGRGWKVKEDGKGYIVYNSTSPHLTHLLEKGHAKRNGGRVDGIPHIAPAEKNAIDNFERRISEAI